MNGERAIIEACLAADVAFFRASRGTLLIRQPGLSTVLAYLEKHGEQVIGLDGFEMDPSHLPRLDLDFDASTGTVSAIETGLSWPPSTWVHITLDRHPAG